MVDQFQSSHLLDWGHPPWPYISFVLGGIAFMVLWRITNYFMQRSLQKHPLRSGLPLSSRGTLCYRAVFAFQAFQTKYLLRPAIFRVAGVNLFGSLDISQVLFTLALYLAHIILIIIPILQGSVNTITGTLKEKVCILSARCIIINLPFLFATTGRCSIVSSLIGVSYRSINFAHRAIGRMCFLAATIHMTCAILFIQVLGYDVAHWLITQPFTRHSMAAFCCLLISVTLSLTWIRTKNFELFLVTHVLAAAILLPMVYYHKTVTVKWLAASAAIWGLDRSHRWLGLFLNHFLAPLSVQSIEHAKLGTIPALVEYLDGAIVLRIPMQFTWTPGQHIYISFWSKKMLSKPWLFGRWHPFTLINLPPDSHFKKKDETTVSSIGQGWMGCCLVQVRNGTTKWLNENAGSQIQVLVDGPYGGHDLWSAAHSTLVLIAGGAGITYILGVIEGLAIVARRKKGGNLRRVEIYWILKNEAQLAWVESKLSEMCSALESFNLIVTAHAYSTRVPRVLKRMRFTTSNRPVPIALQLTPMGNSDYLKIVRDARLPPTLSAKSSLHSTTRKSFMTITTGRPNLDHVFSEICERAEGAVLTHVCGPRSLSDAVKISAAKLCSPIQAWKGRLDRSITIHHEIFNPT